MKTKFSKEKGNIRRDKIIDKIEIITSIKREQTEGRIDGKKDSR